MAFPTSFVPSVGRVDLPRAKGGRPRRNGTTKDDSVSRYAPRAPSCPTYVLGSRGSAALKRERNRWQWTWLVNEQAQHTTLRLFDGSATLFPPTIEPQVTQPDLPLDVIIASATEYIRGTPDIYEPDAVSQLVAEELAATYHDDRVHSPRKGRTLAVVHHPKDRIAKVLLCFPTGAIGNELNVSPFVTRSASGYSEHPCSSFVPSASPTQVFQLPILQIVTSPAISDHRLDCAASCLLVRTQTATTMLNLIPNPTFVPPTSSLPVSTVTVGELPLSATEGREHVDVALHSEDWSRAAVVDEGGGVWLWWEEKERVQGRVVKVPKLTKLRDPVPDSHDPFFRVAFGTRPGTVMVMSRTSLDVIDIETTALSNPISNLVTLSGESHQFTSIDKTASSRRATYTCVTTTSEVWWIDESGSGQPALRWVHELGGGSDKDIELMVIPATDVGLSSNGLEADTVILHSSSLGLGQAIQGPSFPPPTFASQPWSIAGSSVSPLSLWCLEVLPPLSRSPAVHVPLVGVTEDGAVRLSTLEGYSGATSTLSNGGYPTPVKIKWDRSVEQLQEQSCLRDGVMAVPNPRAETRHELLHGRWAWLFVNSPASSLALLDPVGFQQHVRELDAPLEYIATAAELARDCAYGQQSETRSALLRRLDILGTNRTREQLRDVSYERHFAFVARITSEDMPLLSDAGTLARQQRQLEAEAGRLRHDLLLSQTILFSEPIARGEEGQSTPRQGETVGGLSEDDLFAQAAGHLSLEEHTVGSGADSFFLLAPQLPDFGVRQNRPALDFDGIQPLLDEWTIGESPALYKWNDTSVPPQSPSGSAPMASGTYRPIRPLPSQRPQSPFGHFPPAVERTSTLPPINTLRPTTSVPAVLGVSSRPLIARSSPPPPSSPDHSMPHFVNTQVERGPFGARPEARTRTVRKKAARKRQGGF